MLLNPNLRLDNAHEDSIWGAAWSPESGVLVTGSVDESIKMWSESSEPDGTSRRLEQKHHLLGFSLGVISVAVDSSGAYSAANSLDSILRIWDISDYSTKAVLQMPPSETWSLAWAPGAVEQGRLQLAVAGGSSNTVRLIDAGQDKQLAALPMPAGDEKQRNERFVLSVAYSPDGRRLAAGSMDGTVAVFDVATGGLLHTLEGHFKPVRSLAFTPDSKMVLTGCDDMHSHLYDVEHGALVEAFSGHESWVLSVSCHPDGTAFATGSSDSKVKLWDMQTRTCAQTLSDHTDQVWGVAFRPDGSRLATVSDDKSICLFDFS